MPFGKEFVVMFSKGLMVIDRDIVAVAFVPSVTRKVIEVGLPADVGVPAITPLELSVSPAGNAPAVMAQV